MFLLWTTKAEADLIRLHEFLDPVNPDAAARVVQQLVAAAGTLLIHPHLGEPPRVSRRPGGESQAGTACSAS